jgi:predicted adenylyl cyclase CyaB
MIEEELKIALPEIESVMRRLIEIGATRTGQIKEIDTYFDSRQNSMSGEGKMLRLREDGKRAILAYRDLKSLGPLRKGIELEVSDFKRMVDVFASLGFVQVGRVEKIRQRFSYERVAINLDNLPFMGYFLDIQGFRENIAHAAERLRIDTSKKIEQNYLELFRIYQKQNNIILKNPNELTFQNETRYQQGGVQDAKDY